MLANPRPVGRIQTRRITMQPNVAGGLHLHNGPVVGSIERGSAIYQVEGGVARWVTSWTQVGGRKPYVVVDQAAIDKAGTTSAVRWSHLAGRGTL